ncbi:MAG: helix-turn-helix transcriptional regulator [Phenylobacterium sp.]|uniref:helix-turn-helix transcriptional regulator n=1 Tax=Phenylobacterium sp. TaxID=1871053 RepID=UPI003BB6A279
MSGFYAAAMGEITWRDSLGQVNALFGGAATVLNVFDRQHAPISLEVYGRPVDTALEYYSGEIHANDPRTPYLYNAPPGSIYYDHMLYDVEEMARDRWCRAAADAIGISYSLGVMLRLPNDVFAAAAVLTSMSQGHATEAAIEAWRRVAPHLEQACALGHVLETGAATQAALLEAVSRKVEGMILLNLAGGPTFINDAAQAILLANDGLALSHEGFAARRRPETRRLQQLVHGALDVARGAGGNPGGRVLITRPSGKRPYVVSVMPAPPTERLLSGHAVGCVVHLQDLADVALPSRATLGAVFGLTDREADLAIELVRCAGLEQAAANARMAHNTARNHLQSIARKTGAQGQTEIVQLLGRLL